MASGRKVLSYRYVQGTSSAPSLHEDDYQDDDEEDYDDYGSEELRISSPGHSQLGGSRTLQYALASSSEPPGIPTFDTITEAVTNLQSRYPSTSTSVPNAVPRQSSTRMATPPHERPPSSASTATSYTVATDYSAPAKITRVDRFESAIRPLSQQPPSLPTIDSGEPLQTDYLIPNANNDDPFSDGSHSGQQAIVSYPQVLRHHSLGLFASRDDTGGFALAGEAHHPSRPPSVTSTQSRGSSGVGMPSISGIIPTPRQVLQMPASLQDSTAEPTVSLVSRPNATQEPQHNPYNPFHSQALTPPVNRIVQRRSPLKPFSPVDHFRHDTEAYASGRNSLPAYNIARSHSPTPTLGDGSYEAVGTVSGHPTGSSHYAGTQYTGMSQSTDEPGGIDGREDDEETLDEDEDHDEGEDKKTEKKPKAKSKFQEFLDKARSDPFLNQSLDEKSKPQNVFADPRRVVFPDTTSSLSDVPGTPVGTRHFGPAPIGRVARRNKTTKCVPLTNGNLVLDLPVPPKLVLPRVGQPEVMKTRYTAVTCDPDDFEKNGHFLRQNQMNRRTELFICITMFNVSHWTSCMHLTRGSERLSCFPGRRDSVLSNFIRRYA
jgi:Chitin synthase N-terminal